MPDENSELSALVKIQSMSLKLIDERRVVLDINFR